MNAGEVISGRKSKRKSHPEQSPNKNGEKKKVRFSQCEPLCHIN